MAQKYAAVMARDAALEALDAISAPGR